MFICSPTHSTMNSRNFPRRRQSPIGSGLSYAFADTSKISVKNAENNTVTVSGVLCCMFDRYACGVTNFDKRTTTHYNSKAEFQNFWYKQDAGYFNDMNENFVVFFVA